MRKIVIAVSFIVFALSLAACDTPDSAGASTSTSSAETKEDDASQSIGGPAGVIDSHNGNHLVIVPFDEADGDWAEVAANRAQRRACPPSSRYPDWPAITIVPPRRPRLLPHSRGVIASEAIGASTGSAEARTQWILRDKTGYKYRFLGFLLKPGKTVTVRTGSGNDGTSGVFWNRKQYVWNNDGDIAGLYRGSDLKKIDTCSWGSAGDWTACK
jgi:lamin tail-like protein